MVESYRRQTLAGTRALASGRKRGACRKRGLLLCTSLLLVGGPVRAESTYDFELYDLSERLVSLSRLRSAARLVLVDFFSETCQPCKAGLPALRRLHARFAQRGLALIIVAVPGGDDLGKARLATERVFAEQPVPFPVTWDKYRRVAVQYGVVRGRALQLPRAFLLTRNGALLRKVVAAAALEPDLARRLR